MPKICEIGPRITQTPIYYINDFRYIAAFDTYQLPYTVLMLLKVFFSITTFLKNVGGLFLCRNLHFLLV